METKVVHQIYPQDSYHLHSDSIFQCHLDLKNSGYVYVDSTPEIDLAIVNLQIVSKRFFKLSMEEKINFSKERDAVVVQHSLFHRIWRSFQCLSCTTIKPTTVKRNKPNYYSRGRVAKNVVKTSYTNPREFYDVFSYCSNLVDSDFERVVNHSFQVFQERARQCLHQILFPLNVNLDYIDDLINSGRDSLTGLKLIKYYYNGVDDKETCYRHTDGGLITISYCMEGGLHAKDFQTHQWSDVEANAPKKPCLIVFCGEALSRLSGTYFKAMLHKVVSNSDRYAFPFFYRARSSALIDMTQLKSQPLNDLLAAGQLEAFPPIVMRDLDVMSNEQYASGVITTALGQFKSDSYWNTDKNEKLTLCEVKSDEL